MRTKFWLLSQWKRQLGKPRITWEDHKIGFKEIELLGVDWSRVAQGRD
jgi:hypothetical protein